MCKFWVQQSDVSLNSSSSKDLELKSGGKYPRARWAEYISARWRYIFAPSLIE